MPNIKIYAQVTIRNAQGKIIKTTRKKLCKSYVRGFVDIIGALMAYTTVGVVDTSGNAKNLSGQGSAAQTTKLNVSAVATNDLFGILLGTNSTPIQITDYHLGTKILHGITANKLSYGPVSVSAPATVGTSRLFTIARTFSNASGESITVEEVGLAIIAQDTVPAYIYVLIEHSLYNFLVVNGASPTVTYTISATV